MRAHLAVVLAVALEVPYAADLHAQPVGAPAQSVRLIGTSEKSRDQALARISVSGERITALSPDASAVVVEPAPAGGPPVAYQVVLSSSSGGLQDALNGAAREGFEVTPGMAASVSHQCSGSPLRPSVGVAILLERRSPAPVGLEYRVTDEVADVGVQERTSLRRPKGGAEFDMLTGEGFEPVLAAEGRVVMVRRGGAAVPTEHGRHCLVTGVVTYEAEAADVEGKLNAVAREGYEGVAFDVDTRWNVLVAMRRADGPHRYALLAASELLDLQGRMNRAATDGYTVQGNTVVSRGTLAFALMVHRGSSAIREHYAFAEPFDESTLAALASDLTIVGLSQRPIGSSGKETHLPGSGTPVLVLKGDLEEGQQGISAPADVSRIPPLRSFDVLPAVTQLGLPIVVPAPEGPLRGTISRLTSESLILHEDHITRRLMARVVRAVHDATRGAGFSKDGALIGAAAMGIGILLVCPQRSGGCGFAQLDVGAPVALAGVGAVGGRRRGGGRVADWEVDKGRPPLPRPRAALGAAVEA